MLGELGMSNILANSDPWIPGLSTFKCYHNSLMDPNMKVESFITNSEMWDEDMVRLIFITHEAEAILNVPLNMRCCNDIRFWIGGSHGKYSVKLGYLREINVLAPPPFQYEYP